MAAIARAVSFRGQKLTKQATSTTEDAYTLSIAQPAFGCPAIIGVMVVSIYVSGNNALYHTSAGLAATDGQLILAGTAFNVPVTDRTPFYLVSAVGVGAIDLTIL